jgi:hypothetical protein
MRSWPLSGDARDRLHGLMVSKMRKLLTLHAGRWSFQTSSILRKDY